MKRVNLISVFSLAMLVTLSSAMMVQAEFVITDHCTIDGAGTLPNGERLSGHIGYSIEGDVATINGRWEHWEECESTTTCNDYTGALLGFCNAYCEAMNCAGDVPEASEVACDRVRNNFFDKGGDRLPCEPCGTHFVINADTMLCRRDGVVLADFWGSGSLNGVTGYTFQVHVQDFAELGADYYQIVAWASDGSVAWVAGDYLSSGNITMTPPDDSLPFVPTGDISSSDITVVP